jgi:hypothetical protein
MRRSTPTLNPGGRHRRARPWVRQPWYRLVPTWTRSHWTPAEVVAGSRRRMQIEQSFRDFKTDLGIRELQLKARRGGAGAAPARLLSGLRVARVLGPNACRAGSAGRPGSPPAAAPARDPADAQRAVDRDAHAHAPPTYPARPARARRPSPRLDAGPRAGLPSRAAVSPARSGLLQTEGRRAQDPLDMALPIGLIVAHRLVTHV